MRGAGKYKDPASDWTWNWVDMTMTIKTANSNHMSLLKVNEDGELMYCNVNFDPKDLENWGKVSGHNKAMNSFRQYIDNKIIEDILLGEELE